MDQPAAASDPITRSAGEPVDIRRSFARKLIIHFTIMTAIGIVLAFIGPFGSFSQPLSYRLVTWVGFAWAGYAIYSPINALADKVASTLDLPRIFTWVCTVTLATFPMAALVWAIGYLPGPVPVPGGEAALIHYFYVWIVGGGITAFFYLVERQPEGGDAAGTARAHAGPKASEAPPQASSLQPAQAAANPLFDALPPHLGSDIIALEMEDHYVRVHTALGSEMVLMRLRDAMAHVNDIEGRQTHRSWWVARGAVEDVVRDGRNVRLILPRNIEAPVSRAQLSELRAQGWL